MPAAVLPPQKRVLGDSTKMHSNTQTLPSPSSTKRRKLDIGSSPATKLRAPNGVKAAYGSSQPKSQFEEEVLEKLTQDINGLKQKNSEKDQQWDRPGLNDFDEKRDSLCFQQIEVEEGTLHGGRTTVKLFGVTEVCPGSREKSCLLLTGTAHRPAIRFSYMSPTSSIISTLLLPFRLQNRTVMVSRAFSTRRWHSISPRYTPFRWCSARTFLAFREIKRAHT